MSMPPLRLLIVDDSNDDADLVLLEMRRLFDVVEHRRVDSASTMREAFRTGEWDAAILDFSLPGFGAVEAFKIAQGHAPDMPCIIVSGVIDTRTAVEAMLTGVRDYVMKDDLARLAPVIARELQGAEVRREGRRAQQSLRESEDRYRTVVEASTDSIFVEDTEQRVILANRAAVEMFGYSLDELQAMDLRQLVHPDDVGQIEDWRRQMDSGTPTVRRYVGRRVRRDDSVFLAEVSLAPLVTDGETIGAAVNVRDVTERVEAEEALRASEERLRAIVETARSGILITDEHGDVRFGNRACEEMLGYDPGELSLLNADVLLRESDRAQTAARRAARLRGEAAPSHYRAERVRKDGRIIHVDIAASVVRLPGEPDGVLVEMRDVTGEVELQEQLFQVQKSEALGTLVAGVAHDLNNMLTPVLGGIELARLRPDEASRWLANAETAARRASDLVQQLLTFSRPSEHRREPLDTTAAASEAVSMARDTFDRRIQLYLEAAEELPPIVGNHGELVQVLMNLILNARDAVAERMEAGDDGDDEAMIGITVDATPDGGDAPTHVRIIVQDNGVGMSEEVRERAFDPFFSTKQVGEGTGLGLATAYRIINDHDGSLELHSVPGVGTTFTIRLPIASREARGGDRDGESAEWRWIGSEHSVLVLDDDPVIVELADAALTGVGCDVVATTDVTEALRIAEERTFDLLVLDLNMPEMSGWQALERFRTIDPELPVLIATGLGSEAETRERGARRLLHKPYTPGQLVAAVADLLLLVGQERQRAPDPPPGA